MATTNSTFRNGSFNNGSWLCACGSSPAWRTVAKDGPSQGQRFLRCTSRPQCSFFLWEVDEQVAEAAMLQVSSPLAPVIAARPVTPSTPSARSPSSGITANATGTVSARPLFYFSSSTSTTQPEHQFSNPFSTNEPEQTTTRIVTETSLQSLRHLGLNTPESTPVKQGKQVVKVDEDESEEDESGILFQITDRLSTDGVRLKPSTEAYLGYLLREKTAIYEAKLLAREVTIEKLMKKMDRMSLKEF